MKKTKELKNKNGITLIALVITIIVMLILVAVTISMAINGGLFDYAGKATGDTKNAINEEQQLANGGITIDGTYYNSIDDYIAGIPAAVHEWTREGDTFTCSHCNTTYTMGQVVNYTAEGKTSTTITATMSGLDRYYAKNSSYPSRANVDENGEQIIEKQSTNWVVLGIEDTNGDGKNETLLITSESYVGVTANKSLYFCGVAGYNNAPEELERICRELYSNSEYGEARSMTIEDVNSCLNNPLQAMNLGGVYSNESAYQTTGNLTTKLKDIPIWNNIKGNHYTPDGANTEEALGNYELNGYYYYLNDEGTALANDVNDTTSPVTEVEKNTIFGSNTDYLYYLASRGVFAVSSYAGFGPGCVRGGRSYSCVGYFFGSDGNVYLTYYAGMRPVVSLNSKLPEVIL